MLDRKTRDYDASEELLEDRIKESRTTSALFLFSFLFPFGLMAFLTISIINLDLEGIDVISLWGLLFLTITASCLFIVISMLLLFLYKDYSDETRYYRTLLFIKKNNEKKN